ncbi:redoxin domain-containing protein [bacterium BMS3Abin03]|nr:redoxin domain-containing protein [bacterium BMS3Abin03]
MTKRFFTIVTVTFSFFLIFFTLTASKPGTNDVKTGDKLKNEINDITVKDMNDSTINLSDYNGTVLMIVNVASKCGNTPQYAKLETLYKKYKPEGFEILAFPCNDFGGQEPGTNEEIKTFCTTNYGVTFKLFDKIKILGKDKNTLYERLTNNDITKKADIEWNFVKFIISKKGEIVARFGDKVQPDTPEIINTIKEELEKD